MRRARPGPDAPVALGRALGQTSLRMLRGLAGACAVLLSCAACATGGPPPSVPTLTVPVVAAAGSPPAVGPTPKGAGRSEADARAAGDRVDVEWRGSWYPAVLLERRGDGWLVHYEDFGDEWDETVGLARIRDRTSRLEESDVEDDGDP